MYRNRKVGVVIPALNEQGSVGKVVNELITLVSNSGNSVIDQVVVCDNGSTDATAELAKQAGAKVVYQAKPGYGIACLTAIAALEPCDIVLFVDADDSCDINQSIQLLDGILDGADLVIGSRTTGREEVGALTTLQKFGNRLSSFLIRMLWNHPVSDLGPFRAIDYQALKRLAMRDQSFGWTVEMQVKAIQLNLITHEIAVNSKVRIGQSKISGTVRGAIGAGIGILSMIAKLRWQQRKFVTVQKLSDNRL